MSKENFQIPENPPTTFKDKIKKLVSWILPENLTPEEHIKALEKSRLKIENIVNTPVNNIIKEKPKNLKKTWT